MDYIIYTFGGQDTLAHVFNGMARIFGDNGSYLNPVGKFALTLGGVWAAMQAMFNVNIGIFGKKWFIPSILLFTLFFAPTSTVWIKDDVAGNAPIKVDNIPFAVAFFASLSSRISYSIAELIEDNLVPAEHIRSRKGGLMFGAKLVGKMRDVTIQDPVLLDNTKQFCKQCFTKPWVMGNILGKRKEALETNDILGFIRSNIPNNFGIYYKDPTTHAVIFKTCRDALPLIEQGFTQELGSSKTIRDFGSMLGLGSRNQEAMTQRMRAIGGDTLEYLNRDNQDIHVWMKQAMMLNANRESIDDWRESFGHYRVYPELIKMNATRGMFQQSFGWIIGGEMAAEYLPLMQVVLFCMVACSIFFVFPMSMMPGGMVFVVTWIKMILWVNSWPIFFAILNCIGMHVLSLRSNILGSDAGLSILSQGSYADMLMNTFGIVQFFAALVPFISWQIFSKGGHGMAMLADRIAPMAAAAGLGAAAVDQNVSLDNISMGTRQIAQQNVGPSLVEDSRVSKDLMTTTQSINGDTVVQQQVSQGALNFNANEGFTKSMQQGRQESIQNQESLNQRYNESQSYGDSLSYEFANSLSQGKISSESFGIDKQQSYSSALEKAQSNAQNMIERDSKLTEALTNMGFETNAGVTVGGAVGKLLGLEVGGKLHAGSSFGARNASEISKDLTANFTNSEREAWNEAKTIREEQRFASNNEEGQRLTDNMRQNTEEQQQLSNEVSSAQSRIEQYNKAIQDIENHGTAMNANLNDELINRVMHNTGKDNVEAVQWINHHPLASQGIVRQIAEEQYGISQQPIKKPDNLVQADNDIQSNIATIPAKEPFKKQSLAKSQGKVDTQARSQIFEQDKIKESISSQEDQIQRKNKLLEKEPPAMLNGSPADKFNDPKVKYDSTNNSTQIRVADQLEKGRKWFKETGSTDKFENKEGEND